MDLDKAKQPDYSSTHSLESVKVGAYRSTDCSFEPVYYRSCHTPVPSEEEDEELDLDLEGHKHIRVGQGHDGDGVYNIGEHKDSIFTRLPNASQNAANAELRAYIKTHIPNRLFLDDYGELLSIETLGPGRLAQLQVKLWRELPRAQAVITAPLKKVDEQDTVLANMIVGIGNQLDESPHVFVLCDRKKLQCNNALCDNVHKDLDACDTGTQTISLEPLLDIATLTPAFNANLFNGRICVFRRENKGYANMGFNVNKLIPKDNMCFCVQCLQFLWDQRVRAWLTIKELTQLKPSESGTHFGGALTPEPFTSGANGVVEHSGIKLDRDIRFTMPSLDGAFELKAVPSSESTNFKYGMELHEERDMQVSLPVDQAFVSTEVSTTAGAGQGHITTLHLNSRPPVNNCTNPAIRSLHLHDIEEPCGRHHAALPIGSLMKSQYFRSTLPSPATANLDVVSQNWLPPRGERPDIKEGGIMRIEILESAERAADLSEDAISGTPSRLSTTKKTGTTPPGKCQKTLVSFFKPQAHDSIEKSQSLAVALAQRPRVLSPDPFTPFHVNQQPIQGQRKSATNTSNPVPIVAHSKQIPPPVYCVCRKPDDGSKMAQCLNSDCPVSWFHYRCLTKGEKLSSRRNNWTCQVCKTSKEYEQEGEEVDLTDFKMPLAEAEVLHALAVCGTTEGVNDPYGMCAIPVPFVPVAQMRCSEGREGWVETYEGEDTGDEDDWYEDFQEEEYDQGGYEEMDEEGGYEDCARGGGYEEMQE